MSIHAYHHHRVISQAVNISSIIFETLSEESKWNLELDTNGRSGDVGCKISVSKYSEIYEIPIEIYAAFRPQIDQPIIDYAQLCYYSKSRKLLGL